MKIKSIQFIWLFYFLIGCNGQPSITGRWNYLQVGYSKNSCYCDTSNYWQFNSDGTFRHGYREGGRFFAIGKYSLNKSTLTLYSDDDTDVVKIGFYKKTYLLIALQDYQNVFIKDKYVGELKGISPIYKGNYFLEGNILEADIDNEHVVFDSVYAYRYPDDKQIFVNGFNREKHVAIGIRFGIFSNNNIYSKDVLLIGSHSQNGIGASSDATVQIGQKYFNTCNNVLTFPYGGGDGKGTGSIKNVVYKEHDYAFNELSAEFEFKATYSTLSESLPPQEITITNGKFTITRMIAHLMKDEVLLSKEQLDKVRQSDFDFEFNSGKSK